MEIVNRGTGVRASVSKNQAPSLGPLGLQLQAVVSVDDSKLLPLLQCADGSERFSSDLLRIDFRL